MTWWALGSGLNGDVYTITITPINNVYIGGSFTNAGGINCNYVAKWDPNNMSWSALGNGTNNHVQALAITNNGDIYVGGKFRQAGNIACNYVAKWVPNNMSWSALGNGTNNIVLAITIRASNSNQVLEEEEAEIDLESVESDSE
jgi:trimeric autotransporter adhesin